MRVRYALVRVVGLENRRPFTGLVSSNLTLSAKISKPKARSTGGVQRDQVVSGSCILEPGSAVALASCESNTGEAEGQQAERCRFRHRSARRARAGYEDVVEQCTDVTGRIACERKLCGRWRGNGQQRVRHNAARIVTGGEDECLTVGAEIDRC